VQTLWFVNDASLQGQFATVEDFEFAFRQLLRARHSYPVLRQSMRTARSFALQPAVVRKNVREVIFESKDRDFRRTVLIWLDKTGPFIDDDRMPDSDDYFECLTIDVTNGGLGEAARRKKALYEVSTFSFDRGEINFAINPLDVIHGLPDAPLCRVAIENCWQIDGLVATIAQQRLPAKSWKDLIQNARDDFPLLILPDALYQNPRISDETFERAIGDRVFVLLRILNQYVQLVHAEGVESKRAKEIIAEFFTGDRAWFSPESLTNQQAFQSELTFPDPSATENRIFGHWHGKISRRYFRLHFQWPLSSPTARLKILYLGPKITKS
jgi:hypothetical protein